MLVLWRLSKERDSASLLGVTAVLDGAREGERPHPGRAPQDSSCMRCPEPLPLRSFCSGERGAPSSPQETSLSSSWSSLVTQPSCWREGRP